MGRATRRRPRPTALHAVTFQGSVPCPQDSVTHHAPSRWSPTGSFHSRSGHQPAHSDVLSGVLHATTELVTSAGRILTFATAAQPIPHPSWPKVNHPARSTDGCRSFGSATVSFMIFHLVGLSSAETVDPASSPHSSSVLPVLAVVLIAALLVFGVASLGTGREAAEAAPTEVQEVVIEGSSTQTVLTQEHVDICRHEFNKTTTTGQVNSAQMQQLLQSQIARETRPDAFPYVDRAVRDPIFNHLLQNQSLGSINFEAYMQYLWGDYTVESSVPGKGRGKGKGKIGPPAGALGKGAATRLAPDHSELHRLEQLNPAVSRLRMNDQTLTELNLSDSRIKDVGPLASALEINGALTELNLIRNQIKDVGPLASVLEKNKVLLKLCLNYNWINDLTLLASALEKNQMLTMLDLNGNQVEDVGPLASALEKNQVLTYLDLSYNEIKDVGPLASALEKNQTLTELNLSANPVATKLALVRITVLTTANQTSSRIRQQDPIDISTKAKASLHWGVGSDDLVPVSVWDDQEQMQVTKGFAPRAPRPSHLLSQSGPGQRNVDPLCWSLSVAQWIDFILACVQTDTWKAIAAVKGEYAISMYDLNQHFVIPWTSGTGCSIALLMNTGGKFEVEGMFSHAWAGSVVETYNCIQNMVNHQDVPQTARFFFCTFSMYQPEDGAANGLSISEQIALDPFMKIIESNLKHGIKFIHTSRSEIYSRLWVAHEANVAIHKGINIVGLFDMYKWYHSVEKFEQTTIKTREGKCSVEKDRQYIDNLIQQYGGYDRLDQTIAKLQRDMSAELSAFLDLAQGGSLVGEALFDWEKMCTKAYYKCNGNFPVSGQASSH